MSEQILLQGIILGIEKFLLAAPEGNEAPASSQGDEEWVASRFQWVILLSEVLPRALLAELGLPRVLLGSSGRGQFLLVLPGTARAQAEAFLETAARDSRERSGGAIQLVWSVTENLGDWSVVRKRLVDELQRKRGAPLNYMQASFTPYQPVSPAQTEPLGHGIRRAASVGWSSESPGQVLAGSGKYSWNLSSSLSDDGITLARHTAPSDDGHGPADLETLSQRAQGSAVWGVLRGDVDSLGVRLRRVHTIEEHVRVSMLYKQFFAGELEVLCSHQEFWRKVTVLYSGGDDFAVCGSWDALILLAREMQRLFRRFSEENLKDFPGPEGKTISMALALASPGASLRSAYEQAGRNLKIAKSSDKDCIYLFGSVLEWKQLSTAAELSDALGRIAAELRSIAFLAELGSLLRTTFRTGSANGTSKADKFWRFNGRLNHILGTSRDRESSRLKGYVMNELVSRGAVPLKLRPAGLVALEWARMAAGV